MTIPASSSPRIELIDVDDVDTAERAERDQQGRFAAQVGRDAIYSLVKDVALRATDGDIEAAGKVTTRSWNEARVDVFALGPETASAVTKALGMGWRECVTIALLPPAKRAVAQASRESGQGRDASDELIRRALRAVAHRLKESPTPDAYDRVVAEIEEERSRRFGKEFGLPSSRTIRARFDSWEDACRDAELDPPEKPVAPKTAEPFELYVACVRETGCAPAQQWFEDWCRIKQRQLTTERFSDTVTKAKDAWTASGDAWPAKCPRKTPLPEADPAAEGDRRRRGYWTDELVLDALRRYIQVADAEGANITQRHYRACARDRKELDLPAASLLSRRGTLADLIELARRGARSIP